MGRIDKTPGAVAGRARDRIGGGHWRRETHTLPRQAARDKARAILTKFPKAAYMTEVESWRELDGDRIEFTMRRLPTAD
jgi:hypothetical protein